MRRRGHLRQRRQGRRQGDSHGIEFGSRSRLNPRPILRFEPSSGASEATVPSSVGNGGGSFASEDEERGLMPVVPSSSPGEGERGLSITSDSSVGFRGASMRTIPSGSTGRVFVRTTPSGGRTGGRMVVNGNCGRRTMDPVMGGCVRTTVRCCGTGIRTVVLGRAFGGMVGRSRIGCRLRMTKGMRGGTRVMVAGRFC